MGGAACLLLDLFKEVTAERMNTCRLSRIRPRPMSKNHLRPTLVSSEDIDIVISSANTKVMHCCAVITDGASDLSKCHCQAVLRSGMNGGRQYAPSCASRWVWISTVADTGCLGGGHPPGGFGSKTTKAQRGATTKVHVYAGCLFSTSCVCSPDISEELKSLAYVMIGCASSFFL